MSKDIKGLQKLIEERAKKKLRADLLVLIKVINEQPLLQERNDCNMPYLAYLESAPATFVSRRPNQIFYNGIYDKLETDNTYMAQLYRYWLPVYLERESVEFLQKVDQLQNEVIQLFEIKADRGEGEY